MNEKELLTQLNNLKNIKPDKKWKETSREILMSQIYGGDSSDKTPIKLGALYYLRNFIHQPVLMVATILLIVFGGGIFSISASRDTKPGDSLYIAKIISEKAQQAITFNEESKAKLGIEFAGNRAKEIAQVLAESNNGDKDAKVEKLAWNFQKEINTVKTRLKKINVSDIEEAGGPVDTEDDAQMFSANLGKEERGMEIYVKEEDVVIKEAVEEDAGSEEDIVITTPETQIGATSTASISSDVESVLEEAEKLFSEQDYDGALDKLEEAIVQIDDTEGEVKGDSEQGDSEEEVVSEEEAGDEAPVEGSN